jgi:tRNA modification GTPase
MALNNTIAAISTPVGEGAIAIVRTSGPRAIGIADRLFRGKIKLSAVHSHTVHHGQVVDPETGLVVDDVLVSLMKGPATYTGEDLAEINCHGGQLVTQKILQLVIRSGACLASPGEFTRRAFLNGRLDLAQAEAVVDLIRSKADLSLKVAMRQLSGGLSKDIAEIRRNLIDALALVETEIDFTDQELGIEAGDQAILAMGKCW